MAGDILWSGYKAASANVLTTELNSLADGNVCALSAEIDNTSNKYILADLQLDLASLTISSTSAFVSVFVVPTVDGTNYPDWASGAFANYHGQYFAASAAVRNVSSTTARANARGILVPPGKFKVALYSKVGVTLASSNNTLAARYYNGAYS